MALPIVVTFFAQIIVLNDKLPQFWVPLQSLEYFDEPFRGDVVRFYLQRFDSAMLLQEESQFFGSFVSHKTVVNYDSRFVSELLEKTLKWHWFGLLCFTLFFL